MPQVHSYAESPRYPEGALSFADLRAYDPDARLTSGESRFCCPLPACAGREIKKENRCFTLNGRTGVYLCHRCKGAGKVTDKWEDRAPMTRQGRSQAALRRFTAPPAPPKEYAPKPAEEWQYCLRGLRSVEGTGGMEYLRGRGIPEYIATTAGVGYALKWPGNPGIDSPCVVFPVHDANGLQVAAQARSIEDSGKRTAGSVSCGLFATAGALSGSCIVLTEAPIDALSLATAGIPAVALCGLTLREWLLPALAWKTLIVATDADEAGDKALIDWQNACAPFGVHVLRVRPEGGKDWNEILMHYGSNAIRKIFAGRDAILTGQLLVTPYADIVEAAGRGELAFTVEVGGVVKEANYYVRAVVEPFQRGEQIDSPHIRGWLGNLFMMQWYYRKHFASPRQSGGQHESL